MGLILGLILFFVFLKYFSSDGTPGKRPRRIRSLIEPPPSVKGTRAEQRAHSEILSQNFPSDDIFHDLYVEKKNGFFSQIDLLLLTKVGVIVIEVKNYSGWIFGSGNRQYWTQVLAYGKEKHRFYSPVMQNQGHIYDLKKSLGFSIPFYSLIVFDGDCVLKKIDCIPRGVFITGFSNMSNIIHSIINNNKTVNYINKELIIQILKRYEENGKNPDIRNQHIQNTRRVIENKK